MKSRYYHRTASIERIKIMDYQTKTSKTPECLHLQALAYPDLIKCSICGATLSYTGSGSLSLLSVLEIRKRLSQNLRGHLSKRKWSSLSLIT